MLEDNKSQSNNMAKIFQNFPVLPTTGYLVNENSCETAFVSQIESWGSFNKLIAK